MSVHFILGSYSRNDCRVRHYSAPTRFALSMLVNTAHRIIGGSRFRSLDFDGFYFTFSKFYIFGHFPDTFHFKYMFSQITGCFPATHYLFSGLQNLKFIFSRSGFFPVALTLNNIWSVWRSTLRFGF